MDNTLFKKQRIAKISKFIKIIILLIVLAVIGYGVYLITSYKRLPDLEHLEVYTAGDYSQLMDKSDVIDTKKAYNFMTYNIGFGAYTPEYSAFIDGGTDSVAKSEEGLMANICEIAHVINVSAPDFLLLQEVDLDGTRSYHINEIELINDFIDGYYYNYAVNYDSAFLMYPLLKPYGANKSCIATYSNVDIKQSVRRSLPIETDFNRFVDLDRCYSVTKILTDKSNYLCIYNVHLSAYTKNESIRNAQLQTLFDDMEKEYAMGNYVICGGDFNHDLKNAVSLDENLSWATPFPREMLPKGFNLAIDMAHENNIVHNTCRNADKPYDKDSFTVTVDGFITSDNMSVNFYTHSIWDYEYSDHDPVIMQVLFK